MAYKQIKLGDLTKNNIDSMNDNFSNTLAKDNAVPFTPESDYNPSTKKYVDDKLAGTGTGDMLKEVYDLDDNGIVDSAEKVENEFTLTINSGTTEGSTKYTFDGSVAKALNIAPGTNITLDTSSGALTINANDTITNLRYSDTISDVNLSTSNSNGNLTLGNASVRGVALNIPSDPTSEQQAQLPVLSAIVSFVSTAISALEAVRLKGGIAGGAVSTYGALTPAASKGDKYYVTTAGKINGIEVESGDALLCIADTAAATSGNYQTIVNNWLYSQVNISGAVVSDNATVTSGTVPKFSGTNGRQIESSGFTLGKTVPSDAVFTDTVPTVTNFNNTTNWSSTATDGIYTLTLTIASGRYPVAVFRLISTGKYGIVDVGIELTSGTKLSNTINR